MKIHQQDAYVLHTRLYLETSLIVELFTREHGRVSVVAKGVRGKKKSPPRQFVHCLASWVGRGPLFTLTECDLTPAPPLQGDALACGFYMNELLLRMTQPMDVHDHLFEIYSATVSELTRQGDLSVAMRRFEHALLRECGYAPDFTCCADSGKPIDAEQHYELLPERGFVVAAPGESAVMGAHLLAIHSGDFRSGAVRTTARKVFQAALRPHLGERPLASRELLRPMGGS